MVLNSYSFAKKKSLIRYLGIVSLLFLFLIPFINGEIQTIGPFKQYSCINLPQICDNCTYIVKCLSDGFKKAQNEHSLFPIQL